MPTMTSAHYLYLCVLFTFVFAPIFLKEKTLLVVVHNCFWAVNFEREI